MKARATPESASALAAPPAAVLQAERMTSRRMLHRRRPRRERNLSTRFMKEYREDRILPLEVAGEIAAVEQNAVLERLVPSFVLPWVCG